MKVMAPGGEVFDVASGTFDEPPIVATSDRRMIAL